MQAETVNKRTKPGTVPLPSLGRIRKERGYSIRELAERAGVSPNTVFLLEHMRTGASPRTRRCLAKALDAGVRDLWAPNEEVDET